MIFLTVGTQKFPFDRLIKIVDILVGEGVISSNELFSQIGTSTYIPKNFEYKKKLTEEDMAYYFLNSEIIISHAGAGTMIKALKSNKRLIVFPRSSEYGEHIDNHQFEIANLFSQLNYCLCSNDYQSLKNSIRSINKIKVKPFNSNTDLFLENVNKIIVEQINS